MPLRVNVMSKVAVNIVGVVLGAWGALELAKQLVDWNLPYRRLQALEEALDETDALMRGAVEAGLPFDPTWKREIDEKLERCVHRCWLCIAAEAVCHTGFAKEPASYVRRRWWLQALGVNS